MGTRPEVSGASGERILKEWQYVVERSLAGARIQSIQLRYLWVSDVVLMEFHAVFKYLKGCRGAEGALPQWAQLVELAQWESRWKG